MPIKHKNKTKTLKIPKSISLPIAFLSKISEKWTTAFAAKLFGTPMKFVIPKREIEMDVKSIQKNIFIPSINKSVVVYEYGDSDKLILLVHGWSGRGTQLVKIADALLQNNYKTISFDAPGHGKSPGNRTIMLDFIEIILELEKIYGKFEASIGHSLGGISLLNAARLGFGTKKIITIGAADKIEDIIQDFIAKINLQPKYIQLLKAYFERKYNQPMNDLSAFKSAAVITTPVLVIHDNNDDEVPVFCAHNIFNHLKNGTLLLTDGLGHKKILGDDFVIEKIVGYL